MPDRLLYLRKDTMKILVIFALVIWALCVHRRARLGFVIALAICIWCLALYGCAAHKPEPIQWVMTSQQPPQICVWNSTGKLTFHSPGYFCAPIVPSRPMNCGDLPRDGSYILLECKP